MRDQKQDLSPVHLISPLAIATASSLQFRVHLREGHQTHSILLAVVLDGEAVVELLLHHFGDEFTTCSSDSMRRSGHIVRANGSIDGIGKYLPLKGMDALAGQLRRAIQRMHRDFTREAGMPEGSAQLLRLVAAPGMGKVGVTVSLCCRIAAMLGVSAGVLVTCTPSCSAQTLTCKMDRLLAGPDRQPSPTAQYSCRFLSLIAAQTTALAELWPYLRAKAELALQLPSGSAPPRDARCWHRIVNSVQGQRVMVFRHDLAGPGELIRRC